ncbi:MAG: HDOD domain-containing protein [Candidatus Eisenbacteria bacterium]|nr:HDOD domain-containing protein [Candidatus Eisenbacteria bacterium]
MEKSVLFVDDDPHILSALRRMLMASGCVWDLTFAGGGREALEILEGRPHDVIVSDMRMPGMTGAELLEKVRSLYPETVRIVLSGHTELETAMRLVPIAHNYIAKPCDSETIIRLVQRACDMHDRLNNEELKQRIGKIGGLPNLSTTYHELVRLLSDPDAALDEVVKIIERDVGMVANILHLVNTAFYAPKQRITKINQAVSYIGITVLKSLFLSAEAFRAFEGKIPAEFSLEEFQNHGMEVGSEAAEMMGTQRERDDAFLAGMLHDVGKLVLLTEHPDQYQEVLRRAESGQSSCVETEREIWQVTHADVGGYILGLWFLPYTIVEAVTYHHNPPAPMAEGLDVTTAVYRANERVNSRKDRAEEYTGAKE